MKMMSNDFNKRIVVDTLRFWVMALPIMLIAGLWYDKSFYLILIDWWQSASQNEVRYLILFSLAVSLNSGAILTVISLGWSGYGDYGETQNIIHTCTCKDRWQHLKETTTPVIAGALLLASLFTSNVAMAADLKNPILGKWEVIQPKNESLPLAQTAIAKIEFRENKMIQDGQEHKVAYHIKDKNTVFVKLNVGPVGAPGEKITIRKGKLCRQIAGINGGQLVEYKRSKGK